MSTIQELFEKQVVKMPNTIAAEWNGQAISYGLLNYKANQLAHYLRKLGIKPDTPVAVCMERSIDFLVTILGILKAGGAYIPLDPANPENRLTFILNDNNSPVLIIKTALKLQFKDYIGSLIILDEDINKLSQESKDNPEVISTGEHLAYIIYSSGTTGKPKGVLIEHTSVINFCRWFGNFNASQPGQRIDFSSNHSFDMAIPNSIVSLMLGLTIVICPNTIKNNLKAYLEFIDNQKIQTIKLTPSYFRALLHEIKNHSIGLQHLKTIILGGEILYVSDCASWLEIYPNHHVINEYGPTETTVAVTQYPVRLDELSLLGKTVPIGTTCPNVDCYILTSNLTRVAEGEVGELYIGGTCVARGYLNQPELTQEKFIQNPFSDNPKDRLYKTGDLCRQLPNGMIEIIGRIDSQIKIRGFRVEIGEVEYSMSLYHGIKNVAVIASENQHHEKQLIAYYTAKDSQKKIKSGLIQKYLKKYLPDYMIPTAFIQVETFILTANGKLDYKALPKLEDLKSPEELRPKTALEKRIAEIWSEELGIKSVGLDDDFFNLGGHSLSALRIISTVYKRLGKEISLPDFYQASTVKKLANRIKKVKKVYEKSCGFKHEYHKSSCLPLSDFQFILWLSNTFEPKVQKLNIATRKRLQGRLDIQALRFAFSALIKKHEILNAYPLKFRPAQVIHHNRTIELLETNLCHLSKEEVDSALECSMLELRVNYPWDIKKPMLMARLFYFNDNLSELQISMPHIILDDVSPDILLTDLSKFYLLYEEKKPLERIQRDSRYRDYLIHEQQYFHNHTQRDFDFWKNYISDASLLAFPEAEVVKGKQTDDFIYSSYLKIPEKHIKSLQKWCREERISISDGLAAILLLALKNTVKQQGNQLSPIVINVVKSTRDNAAYDDVLGCFLRVEPIKVSLNNHDSLESLGKKIHQSAMETSPYQQSSSLVKFACIGKLLQQRKVLREYLVRMVSYVYVKLFPTPTINRSLLNLCAHLAPLDQNNHDHKFLINLNVNSNFLFKNNKKNLFDLRTEKINAKVADLLNIDYLFDVCFLRDENQGNAYLAISSNLKPAFRELIGKEVIRIMSRLG